jgi:uncharacterized protein YhaN
MDETTEKYLSQMLEGYERNITQIDTALEQMAEQLKGAEDQKETMLTAIEDLRGLLGLSEEEEDPE